METNLATVNSYSEMQWRERQVTLSFTYRFNKAKNDREKPKRTQQDNGDGGDFPGQSKHKKSLEIIEAFLF